MDKLKDFFSPYQKELIKKKGVRGLSNKELNLMCMEAKWNYDIANHVVHRAYIKKDEEPEEITRKQAEDFLIQYRTQLLSEKMDALEKRCKEVRSNLEKRNIK